MILINEEYIHTQPIVRRVGQKLSDYKRDIVEREINGSYQVCDFANNLPNGNS